MNYLTLCCIAKDETLYLKEWVDYHTLLGVERFIIYDNESTIPIRQSLADYLTDEYVTVIDVQGKGAQIPAYGHCLENFGPTSKWIGFLDLDEFLLPKPTDDLRILLTDYEDYGGLGINWVVFSSSGHLGRASGSQIANYLHRFPYQYSTNYHIKSIVQPHRTLAPFDPHRFTYRDNYYCVNEDYLPITGSFSPHCVNKVQINHYFFRSQQDFEEKLTRGRSDNPQEEFRHQREWFYSHLQEETIFDDGILDYLPKMHILAKKNTSAVRLELFRKGLPETLERYASLVTELIQRGITSRAEELSRLALIYFGGHPYAWWIHAMILRLTRQLAKALPAIKKSLSLQETPEALYELVTLYGEMGKKAESLSLARYLKWRLQSQWQHYSDWIEKVDEVLTGQ